MPGNRKPRKPRRNKKRKKTSRRRIVNMGETKLQKQIYDEISHGVLNKNEAATLICPYALDQTNVSPPTEILFPSTWNNTVPGTQFYHNNFVSQGTAYNQRVGRRISAQSASVDLQFGFVSSHPTASAITYPLYASLRIIHGWCKEGVQQLQEVLTDVPHMYSEVPFSKYKVLSDKTYTCRAQPAVTVTTATPSEVAVYRPFRIKKTWHPKGANITFTDSLATVTYAGWTPFILILNPHHGVAANNLMLEFKYIKRVFAFKDA